MKSSLSALATILALAAAPSPCSLVPSDGCWRWPGQEISREAEDQPETIVIEGHAYSLVRLGTQTWLAESLLASRDRDGNSLTWVGPEGADTEGEGLGRLYTWESARRTAPAGWRLPTVKDWQALIVLSGGEPKAGRKLLRTGPGEFAALLIGGVDVLGRTFGRGELAAFWTSAETSVDQAFCLTIARRGEIQLASRLKTSCFSVRLIRDDSPDFAAVAPSSGSR
ncbi:MAG: fibrobacter succinogenes major paralogous domain-containing protein [Candidatus Aminicenantes bacterium]|nr:fibrobacter succinogenes major paralogous domain-containing protein [Candidatus Aminicenantes bacterium]